MSEENREVRRFSLKRKEVFVDLEKPDTQETLKCVIRELDGHGRDKHLNDIGRRTKTAPDGTPSGVSNFEGLHANLLALSLWEIKSGGQEQLFSVPEIQKFPASVQSELADISRELSGLNPEAEEEAGND
jgi:hypothetical protein